MAKKKRRQRLAAVPAQNRATEALTVGWMLAVFTTLLCECAAAIVWLATRANAEPGTTAILLGYLRFSALITATLSLVLLAVVLKRRSQRPPRAIVIVALLIAGLAIATAFL